MSKQQTTARSIGQRVRNRGRERGLQPADALVTYAMDRLLFRLGRSSQRDEFFLKGGLLVANLAEMPNRFTRDIDVARRHGPPDPGDVRSRFQSVVALDCDDGVCFEPKGIRATLAERLTDGYDGVKVLIATAVGGNRFDIKIDVGFGDAIVPNPERTRLIPFFDGDESAFLLSYPPEPVIAEKVECLLSNFPLIAHRLKDILDVVALADSREFDGRDLRASLVATFERRQTPFDVSVLERMMTELKGRKWTTEWAKLLKEKRVSDRPSLSESVARLDAFIRPVLIAARDGTAHCAQWKPVEAWTVGVVPEDEVE